MSWIRAVAGAALAMAALGATGCAGKASESPWTTPSATYERYVVVRGECMAESTVTRQIEGWPVAATDEDLFSACMEGRGWRRCDEYPPAR